MARIRRFGASSEIDIALGSLAPILVAAWLVAVRGEIARTNVALILAVVVVTAGAFGGRAAAMAAGATAAASFDFFHTRPYLSLLIHDTDDVEMTLLLLILGLVAGQLAWRAGVAARQRDDGGGLDQIRVADLVARGDRSVDVIAASRLELIELFHLVDCQFEAAPFHERIDIAQLERNGVVAHRRYRVQPGGDLEVELPAEGIALPIMSRGQIVGRFILDFGPSAGATLEQRIVAIALADQVGASLTAFPVGALSRERNISLLPHANVTNGNGTAAASALLAGGSHGRLALLNPQYELLPANGASERLLRS